MGQQTLLGDLRERPDGSFDGWCWAPDRPDERLIVDLLVNDTLAISMVAAIFRRDLQTGGMGDGRHGFVMRLPPNLQPFDGEVLITARERRSGQVFGRVLREAPARTASGGTLIGFAEQAAEDAWQALDAARAPLARAQPPQRLRSAFGALAGRLAAAAGRRAADWPASWSNPGLPAGPPVNLPDVTAPCLTLAFLARDAASALARIEALAPALALVRANLLAIDPGTDPACALLPARVRNLHYLRDTTATGQAHACNLALANASGAQLIWLGDHAAPSAAALLALADALGRSAPALWLNSTIPALVHRTLPLPSRLGMVLCLDRALCDTLGPLEPSLDDGAGFDCADLACRARMLGLAVHRVCEPVSPLAALPLPSASAAVRALFEARWGVPHLT